MKYFWRIFTFAGSLWRYYLSIGAFTILLAAMSQLQPLFTKGAIDQITKLLKGGHANVSLVALFAVLIFLTDVGQTLLSNIGGYLGDILSVKLQRLMSQRYYEHLLELPPDLFDTNLQGKSLTE